MTFRGLPQIKMHPKRSSNATANDIVEEEIDNLAAGLLASIVAGSAHAEAEAAYLDAQERAADGDEGLTADGIGV